MTDAAPKSRPTPSKNIIPVSAGYFCIPNDTPGNRGGRQGPLPRLPVVAIAERTEGMYQACVLDAEGRLQFNSGPVYAEGASHEASSSSKSLYEIAHTLKNMLTTQQQQKPTTLR